MADERDEPGWVVTQADAEYLTALREAVEAKIVTAGSEFGEALDRLSDAVAAVPPFDLMCVTSLYFLTGERGANPEFNRPADVFQHHVELIHAFALRSRLDEAKPTITCQQGLSDVVEAAKSAVNAFVMLEATLIAAQQDESKRRRDIAISSMRLHSVVVRGWAYDTHLSQVLEELFAPLEDEFDTTLGVRMADLVQWRAAVLSEVDDRIGTHRAAVHKVATAPLDATWPSVVHEAFHRVPVELDDELLETLENDEEQRLGFAIITGDLNLYQVFGFTREALAELYPAPVAAGTLDRVLNAWSLAFGDTGAAPLYELLRNNPVLARPIVQLRHDLYLWTLPATLHHSAFPMMEALIETKAELWDSYLDRRAAYLEDRVAAELRQAFPTGRVATNVLWTDPNDGKQYETDAVVLIGSHALIVESKSGRLSSMALGGRGRWLRDDIDALVVAPARQARRFADFLLDQDGSFELTTKGGDVLAIDGADILFALTVSVTLEPLAGLLPRIGELVEAGFTDEDLERLSHSITLFDLLVIFDILAHPSEILHYLARRAEIEKAQFLGGEEMDLLGFYLVSGFNLGPAEFDPVPNRMQVFGLSDPIDTYHYKVEAGIQADKPRVRRTEWWEQLLSRVEDVRAPRWSELGVAICNVAYEDQIAFEEAFTELQLAVNDGRRNRTDFVFFENGPPERRNYFVGLVTSRQSREARNQELADAAATAMREEEGVQRVILIGWPPTREALPYDVLAVVDRRVE